MLARLKRQARGSGEENWKQGEAEKQRECENEAGGEGNVLYTELSSRKTSLKQQISQLSMSASCLQAPVRVCVVP